MNNRARVQFSILPVDATLQAYSTSELFWCQFDLQNEIVLHFQFNDLKVFPLEEMYKWEQAELPLNDEKAVWELTEQM